VDRGSPDYGTLSRIAGSFVIARQYGRFTLQRGKAHDVTAGSGSREVGFWFYLVSYTSTTVLERFGAAKRNSTFASTFSSVDAERKEGKPRYASLGPKTFFLTNPSPIFVRCAGTRDCYQGLAKQRYDCFSSLRKEAKANRNDSPASPSSMDLYFQGRAFHGNKGWTARNHGTRRAGAFFFF